MAALQVQDSRLVGPGQCKGSPDHQGRSPRENWKLQHLGILNPACRATTRRSCPRSRASIASGDDALGCGASGACNMCVLDAMHVQTARQLQMTESWRLFFFQTELPSCVARCNSLWPASCRKEEATVIPAMQLCDALVFR